MVLVAIPSLLLGLLVSVLFDITPGLAVLPSLLLGAVLTIPISASVVRRNRVTMSIQPLEIKLDCKRRTLSFDRQRTKSTWESREWVSSRTTGHNRWTVMTLRDGETEATIGMKGLLAKPAGRTGQPQHVVSEEVFRGIAKELDLSLPGG
jgi:hypothetical protein